MSKTDSAAGTFGLDVSTNEKAPLINILIDFPNNHVLPIDAFRPAV